MHLYGLLFSKKWPWWVPILTCGVLWATVVADPPTETIELSPVVSKLIDDPITTEDQRQDLALFHGQWERIEQPTPQQLAAMALYRFDLTDPVLGDESVPVMIRARAALARGNADTAAELLKHEASAAAAVVRAEALEELGQVREALLTLIPWRDRLQAESIQDATELTAMAQAVVMIARLEGRPADDYALAMSLFGKAHRELDPLYWPALIAEAQLLADKDNAPEAAQALMEALRLNPKSSEAWYLLGLLAADGYDFDTAGSCVDRLRQINHDHLLAHALEAEVLLTQKDVPGALAAIESGLSQYPEHRPLLALLAAAEALSFNEEGLRTTLDHFDKLSPSNPLAYYTAGRHLSAARQYDAGQSMLQQAIDRASNWSKPRIELGLLMMQLGDEAQAVDQLAQAVRLDPFNRRAHNQLKLARELSSYEGIRTDHFIIRYRQGIDAALARDMPDQLERIYRHITGVFGYQPERATVIQILPDEQHFAVRITGMPDIWTVAACTGDVIALAPPRNGAGQKGTFDWARVIQHEFVHTITLNQTRFRVPHWFTEGCAVSQEPGDRSFDECRLLAAACFSDSLFDLEQINWAFVRPKTDRDRPLAYAQASWMIQFITVRWGYDAVIGLLEKFRDGIDHAQAIRDVTGLGGQVFMDQFKVWAREQVRQWGLLDDDDGLRHQLSADGTPTDEVLDRLLAEHPDHPDLLQAAARRAIEREDPDRARQALLRYAVARPVDPWSHRQLVKLAILTGRHDEAVGSLQQLDRQDSETGQWAHQLAQIHRNADRLDLAYRAIIRALHRQPYHPGYRELAATIQLQIGDPQAALGHLQALVLIEPDRAIHHVRLTALYARMGQRDQAAAAAAAARELDTEAPVAPFLDH